MSWNATLYDNKHSFVSKFGEEVVALLDAQPGERILDAGCGTGDLAALIAETGASVTGVDSSAEMVEKARKKFPAIDFEVAGLTDHVKENHYDAIFSNATLHWVSDNKKAASCFLKSLKPGGRLVVEFGGKGNIEGVINAINKTLEKFGYPQNRNLQSWYFPSIAEYTTVLEDAGFTPTFATLFERPTPLKSNQSGIKDWIRMFGEKFFEGIDDDDKELIIEEIQESLRPIHFRDDNWYADYVRVRFVAIKKSQI